LIELRAGVRFHSKIRQEAGLLLVIREGG
jgi:hypothetical protein